jgi:hypothetical protein
MIILDKTSKAQTRKEKIRIIPEKMGLYQVRKLLQFGGVAQAVQHPPSKYEALSSKTPGLQKKKKKKKRRRRRSFCPTKERIS